MSVLDHIGLSESQVKSILNVEIEKLAKQEKALLDSIKKSSEKINEQYQERQKISQSMEAERLEVENAKKTLIQEKTIIQNEKSELLRIQRDTSLLREKLNEDKDIFRKEKEVINKSRIEIEAELKVQKEITSNLRDKEKLVDKHEDELFLSERSISAKEDALTKDQVSFKENVKELESKRMEVNILRESLEKEMKEAISLKDHVNKMLEDATEELEKKKKEFKKEIEIEKEALRRREYELVKKEKFIEESRDSIKRKLEDNLIDSGRRKKT